MLLEEAERGDGVDAGEELGGVRVREEDAVGVGPRASAGEATGADSACFAGDSGVGLGAGEEEAEERVWECAAEELRVEAVHCSGGEESGGGGGRGGGEEQRPEKKEEDGQPEDGGCDDQGAGGRDGDGGGLVQCRGRGVALAHVAGAPVRFAPFFSSCCEQPFRGRLREERRQPAR
mmetsp:Transcript_20837/g.50971  ORF Transcript_20837/g.50971 Transcript_20837/m.50971 type:complete len:177 (+) Transcript_20837:405-935(+)